MLGLVLGCVVLMALAAGLFIPLEAFFARSHQRIRWRAVLTCSAFLLVNTLAMEAIGAPLLDRLADLSFDLEILPAPLRIAAALLLGDVLGYWTHRAMHHVPALWRLHRVHHADTELNWLETWHQHPIDFVLHGIAVGLPAALLSASLADLASVVLVRRLYTNFLHANVELRLDTLGLVLATPRFHRTHHSQDPVELDTNFAGTFSFIDRMFGTYRA